MSNSLFTQEFNITWTDSAPATAETNTVEIVTDLLAQAGDFDLWTTDTPDVKRYGEDSSSERGNGADMPAVLYVWSPTGSTLDRFSGDGDKFDRQDTIEIQIWSLDEPETQQLQSDVVDILSQFLDDNKIRTPYSDLAPTGVDDFREQTSATHTDHYVMSVEVEARGLQDTAKNV